MRILSKMLSKKGEPKDPNLPEGEDSFDRLIDDDGRMKSSGFRPVEDGLPQPVDADLTKPIVAKENDEPDLGASGLAQDDWDEEWDDDDDWGDEDDPEFAAEERQNESDKRMLVSEIREAMDSVSEFEAQAAAGAPSDTEDYAPRQTRARSRLTEATEEAEDRILEKTEDAMSDHETSRRRSAMAHMKAAAAATKADRVLQHVASRDPSADPEEQSPYRDDLAKVVRPHSTSRPISRVVSRPNAPSPIWDQGTGDEDAAMFAAAEEHDLDDPEYAIEQELAEAEERRLSRTPVDDDEDAFEKPVADRFELQTRVESRPIEPSPAIDLESRFATDDDLPPEPETDMADDLLAEENDAYFDDEDDEDNGFDFDDADDDGFDLDADDDYAPRPSSMVSEAIAFANGETDGFSDDEDEDEAQPIWDVAQQVASEVDKARAPDANFGDLSAAIAGRAGRSAGRVKTRLLGFQADEDVTEDVFGASTKTAEAEPAAAIGPVMFPAGWFVVVEGPGRGASFPLLNGVSQIGRGEGQTVRLDFGDTSISRNNHAAVAYDDEQGKYFLGHGGKSNLVRLNGKPVLTTEELSDRDEIRIGETKLTFVALCGEKFTWSGAGDDVADE